jgi:Fungal N-terminal domain of STAND proteins
MPLVMEVVGVIASVAQLADYTGLVLVKLHTFCHTVKDAPTQAKQIRDELQAVISVLHSLGKIEQQKRICHSLQVFRLDAVAAGFNETLKNIERRLRPNRTTGFRRLTWPFTKAEVERVLLRLERFKATSSLALNLHHRYPAVAQRWFLTS